MWSTTFTNRLTETGVLYDNLNRIYQSQVYDISPSTGTGGNYLAQNAYYDRNNRPVAAAPAYAAAPSCDAGPYICPLENPGPAGAPWATGRTGRLAPPA